MNEAGPYQQWKRILLLMEKRLQISEAILDVLRRRRHIGGVSRARSADTVLTLAKLAGLGMTAAPLRQQNLVDLSDKPGITCLWQVTGRSPIGFERWMELDMEYIDRWSL
jgi:hypothetical protein